MVLSTFWRSRKDLTNLPKLSCGFKLYDCIYLNFPSDLITWFYHFPLFHQIVIPAGHVANFVVTVTAPLTEGQFIGEVIFHTPFEEKRILAILKTVEGYLSVRPDFITMRPSFPVSCHECNNINNNNTNNDNNTNNNDDDDDNINNNNNNNNK